MLGAKFDGNADLGYRGSDIKTPNIDKLPQALKEAGYQTSMVGKWHLGHADKKYWPQNRGFDPFYGNLVGEVDYFTKMRGGIVDWQRDGKFIQPPTTPQTP